MPLTRAALRWSLATASLPLAIAGCGDAAGPGERLSDNGEALSFDSAFANDQPAFDYFVGKGLTNFQAAGIVGNLDQESGVNPGSVQSGGPGRGIAQWSVGGRWDTDSKDNAVWYAGQQGASVTSLTLQLDFIWYELQTFSGYGLAALKATTNVSDATVAFETDFEGCGTCDQSTRISYAQSVLSSYGAVAYGAQWVSQSFPLATTTLTMTAGQVIPSSIVLKNTGTKAWGANTRIGTTQPRDRKSAFADGSWLADNRPAGVTGTVAPGATYKFTFDLAAPSTPGTYDEFFGVVEDGVAWFSDPGQGGPPDNDLEVKITVVAGSGTPDAGSKGDAGTHPDGGVHEGDAGVTDDAGSVGTPVTDDDGGAVVTGVDGGETDGGGTASSFEGAGGGCNVTASRVAAPPWTAGVGVVLALGALAGRRRRSRRGAPRTSRA